MITQYGLYVDEWSHTLTPVVSSGTPDPDFPISNLQAFNLAIPFKFATTFGAFDCDRGSSSPFGLMSLLHTNLSGAVAEIIASDSPTYSPFDLYTFVLPTIDKDKYFDNPVLDLSSATPRRYTRTNITGNASAITLGGIWYGSATDVLARGFIQTPAPTDGEYRPRIPTLRTVANVPMGFQSFGRQRYLVGTVKGTPTELAAVRDIERAQDGESLPFLLVPDATVNSAYLVELATGITQSQPTAEHEDYAKLGDYPLWQSMPWGVRERARGRAWGTF